MTERKGASKLGALVLERGLVSRQELERLIAREQERPPRLRRPVGELLIAHGQLTATLLDELLAEQRDHGEVPAAAAAQVAEEAALGTRPALEDLLALARGRRAEEVLLAPERPPALRVGGVFLSLNAPAIEGAHLEGLCAELFSADALEATSRGRVARQTFTNASGRFLAIAMPTAEGLTLTCRALSVPARSGSLRLPAPVVELAHRKRGLVIVAGGQGAERASVVAELVCAINAAGKRHVITIERSVTFHHESAGCLVAQREVGTHTRSFRTALRAAIREDPDVLVVGEINDPEAIATALLAAETGHLVICSLHAAEPDQVVRRLVDAQPSERRALVRASLAGTLQAIAILEPVRGADGERFLVADVIPGTPAIQSLIRDDRMHQLQTMPASATGVIWRDEQVLRLFQAGRLKRAVALERLRHPESLDALAAPA